jgi:tetratricopeptide (TPR) repeat protein
LTEHVQDLVHNMIQDRERYLAAQRQALKDASSPERKKYLQSIINGDDLNQSDQLMRQSSTNYWGGMFNRLLSSVDLVGVASGNYVGAAVETAISQIYGLASGDMSIEERRALARNLDHLKRFPDDPRNSEIAKKVEALEKKKKTALAEKQLKIAREAAAKGDLDRALFHAQVAAYIHSDSKAVQKVLQEATEHYQQREEWRKKGLGASPEMTLPPDQQEDARRLLQVLTLGDAHAIERVAVDIGRKHPGTPLADAALDAEAVALEMKGHHEAAKKLIKQIARSSANPDARKRAAALLQSPEYNLLATFHDAHAERRLQMVKYVLLGEDFLKKNLLYGAGVMAAAGPAGAATLGMVNAIMLSSNLVQVLSNNPISAQPVIDAGVAYIHNHPNSESASEVYRVLGEAYEERGLLDKAISYYELSGTGSKEKVAALKEKSAQAFLNATKNKERAIQEAYLTTIIDHFPESSAAAEATKKLATLAKDENQGLRMSKQFLMENPELYGPGALGLKASLFDGNTHNMELADRGVNLIGDNEILIYYQTPWGVRSQSYPLPKQKSDRFYVALRQKNHAVAMADVNQRARGSVGGLKDMPLPILRAEREKRDEKSEERDDSTFTLIREAAGPRPDFPKVLDYEMLSENERDPGSKYKLPPIQGSISASRFSMTGGLPTGLWGNQLAIGTDYKSPFAGVQLPIPLLEGFVPIDFMVQGRPGGVAIYPRIHTGESRSEDQELYK